MDRYDVCFESKKILVEFKIAYNLNTISAVREALGQILEYNHFPPRESHHVWLLILDTLPSSDDRAFIHKLRTEYSLPLILGWQSKNKFDFFPKWPL